MAKVINELSKITDSVMRGLKDFQRATVDRIDCLYRAGQQRILVSDEVGLGKTLIARGAIAKLAQLRVEEHDRLFKVVYICSNVTIADQNLYKLRISKDLRTEDGSSSRLSMQHLQIFRQEFDTELLDGFIQLIPLTPDTSFRMTSGTGAVEERALMFAILRRLPELKPYRKALEVAMTDYAYSSWANSAKDYEEKVVACNKVTKGEYLKYMLPEVSRRISKPHEDEESCLDQLIVLCKKIKKNGYKRVGETRAIGLLRVLFAQISVDRLDPDFVIMDEFQRFKYLIESGEESETGMLAKRFFEGKDLRMLLLSATPYKMYSTLEEINEKALDEHYAEFFNVMDFLRLDNRERERFREVWSDYSVKLRELSQGATTIIEIKNAAEDALYASMCRTERISEKGCADIIDASSVKTPLKPDVKDIRSYIQAQRLLDDIGLGVKVPVDFVKSSPYLLSFMRDYQMKREVEKYFKQHPEEQRKADKSELWLQKRTIEGFSVIDPANARLKLVTELAFTQKAEALLWVPPSRPYYELSGVFKGKEGFTKTLVFSSWEMVPRMIASMLSYESERRNIEELKKHSSLNTREARYFSDSKRRYPPARLNFSVSLGDPKGMPLFCLLYPSHTLAGCFDPVDTLNRGLKLSQLRREIEKRIIDELQLLKKYEARTGRDDDRWYYLAPMLMDTKDYLDSWLAEGASLTALLDEEGGEETTSSVRRQRGFLAHLSALKEQLGELNLRLGSMPEDLTEVLTNMVLASPAVCAYRTYRGMFNGPNSGGYSTDMPSQIAKIFINRMNTPEATAVIEAYKGKSEDAHWKNLLDYCSDGNLRAVFDEYAHIISESNGLEFLDNRVAILHRLILESMNVRTATYSVDTFDSFSQRIGGRSPKALNFRTHFAVAFTKSDGGAGKDADRKKTVRNSFNSPFRPFVLATTSIGQEGLDFHYYCRRIVHWNLPSNPIDLEQREGRINRYKCLAIRQNVAKRYGNIQFGKDVWREMFDKALECEKVKTGSELVPYWGLAPSEDMVKIQRIVPLYPFSRDLVAYERLIKILSLYRLTLGQTRQEELLEYIFMNQPEGIDLSDMFMNLSPFYKL